MVGISEPDLRRRLHEWMLQVLKARGWAPEAWARRAETTPTNLTRFIRDPVAAPLPSSRTLAQLGHAAGDVPPLLPYQLAIPTVKVPRLSTQMLLAGATSSNQGAGGYVEWVAVMDDVSTHTFAVSLETDAMQARGLVAGDILIVDPDIPPVHGAVIAVLLEDKVSAGIYGPPYLIPQATSAEHKPLPIGKVRVLGVCRQAIKRL